MSLVVIVSSYEEKSNKTVSQKVVQVVTSENFKEKVNASRLTFIKFYVPLCPHCRKFSPKFENTALNIKQKDLGSLISFIAVNCDNDEQLCDENNVRGYPTIALYANGRYLREYLGPLTQRAMIKYLLKKLRLNGNGNTE